MNTYLSKESDASLNMFKILFFMLILTACSSMDKDPSSSYPLVPTLTHAIELTSVLTPSATPEPNTSLTIPSPTPPSTLEPSPLLTLIKSELLATDCSPPCVFDVVPGQTRADEISALLESLKEEGIVEDFYLVQHPSATSYAALFSSYPLGINIEIDEDENTVLEIGYGTDYKVITFGDIVDRFGEPTLVLPIRDNSFNSLILEYPDEHIRVEVRTDFLGEDHLPISLDMTVRNLVYESPEVSQARLSEPHIWVMWEGYKSFEYYYMAYDQLKGQESN